MLARFCACWLIVLVAVPFTAPFSVTSLPGALTPFREECSPIGAQPVSAFMTTQVIPARMVKVGKADVIRVMAPCALAGMRDVVLPAHVLGESNTSSRLDSRRSGLLLVLRL
jgi:hypothetical protein